MKRTLSNHFIHLHTASSIQKHFLKIESFHLFTWFQPFTYSRKLPQQFPPTHINLSSLLNISCLYKKCYTFSHENINPFWPHNPSRFSSPYREIPPKNCLHFLLPIILLIEKFPKIIAYISYLQLFPFIFSWLPTKKKAFATIAVPE